MDFWISLIKRSSFEWTFDSVVVWIYFGFDGINSPCELRISNVDVQINQLQKYNCVLTNDDGKCNKVIVILAVFLWGNMQHSLIEQPLLLAVEIYKIVFWKLFTRSCPRPEIFISFSSSDGWGFFLISFLNCCHYFLF